MPNRNQRVEVDTVVGSLHVKGVIDVEGPFFGGSSGTDENPRDAILSRSLAERIERAVNTAIKNFREDFAIVETSAGTSGT